MSMIYHGYRHTYKEASLGVSPDKNAWNYFICCLLCLLYYPPQPAQSAMFHILHEYMTRTLLILRLVSRKKYHQILNSYINVYDRSQLLLNSRKCTTTPASPLAAIVSFYQQDPPGGVPCQMQVTGFPGVKRRRCKPGEVSGCLSGTLRPGTWFAGECPAGLTSFGLCLPTQTPSLTPSIGGGRPFSPFWLKSLHYQEGENAKLSTWGQEWPLPWSSQAPDRSFILASWFC